MALSVKDFLSDAKLDHAQNVFVDGDYAYVTSSTQDRLTIFDISDPTNISIESSLQNAITLNEASAVCVQGNYAYVIYNRYYLSNYRIKISVVDITDKSVPSIVYSSEDLAVVQRANKIIIKNDLLFINFTKYGTFPHVLIMSIKDPDAPFVVAKITDSTLANTQAIVIDDNGYLYAGTNSNRVGSVNVGCYLEDCLLGVLSSTYGMENDHIVVEGNYVYTASDNYFKIFDITDPTVPVEIGSINDTTNLDNARDIVIDGNYAYVSSTKGLISISISNKAAPLISSIVAIGSTNYYKFGTCKSGNYVYVSFGGMRLQVVDATNPASMVLKGDVACATTQMTASGNYVFSVNSTTDKLTIIDVSDKDSPSEAGSLTDHTNLNGASDIVVSGNYAFVACSINDSVTVIDVSNKAAPSYYDSLMDAIKLNNIQKIILNGDYVYTVENSNPGGYCCKINISDVDNLAITASMLLTNNGTLAVSDTYLITINVISKALLVFDVTEFSGSYGTVLDYVESADLLNNVMGLDVDNLGGLYAACYNDNMITFLDVSDPTNITAGDYVQDATVLNGVYDLYYVGGYLIAIAAIGDYASVINISTAAVIDNLHDATNLNGARQLFRNLTELYIACYDGDGLAVVDISNYVPSESTFVPKVMLI